MFRLTYLTHPSRSFYLLTVTTVSSLTVLGKRLANGICSSHRAFCSLSNIPAHQDIKMEDDNVSPELPQEHHNAEVKMETQDEPKKSPQPIPLTPSFTPGETIDLLSDGEQEPTAAGFSTTAMDVQPAAEPSDGFASDENAENRVDSRLTHEQIVAKQKEMADKFRTQKQKGAKNLASPLRSEAKESEDDDPAATFAEEKKIYNRKKKANTLTMEDEIR